MIAHNHRWKNEVANLQENSEAERKFLVKKLRELHAELASYKGVDGREKRRYIKDSVVADLQALQGARHRSVMPTTVDAYHAQHLQAKGLTPKEKLRLQVHNRTYRADEGADKLDLLDPEDNPEPDEHEAWLSMQFRSVAL